MLRFETENHTYVFLEIRGIDPKTLKIQQIDSNGKIYIGKFLQSYDCSKFLFYEIIYENGKRMRKKKINSCFGYREYSYKNLQEIGITPNIISSYKISKSL